MRAKTHSAAIGKLAKNTLRSNKKQFSILFFTILLSTCMLFCVFMLGMTWLDLSRLQNTRLFGAEYDATVANGFTREQKDILLANPKVQTVGSLSYAGYVKSTQEDDTIDVGLLWCDEVYWETQSAPARTSLEGHYPKKKHELLVTREALNACGEGSLSCGDSFPMTYEDNTGIHTQDFVISGIWEGYGNQAIFYVSDAFYKDSGYSLDELGILYIKYKGNFISGSTIEKTEASLSLTGQQLFQASDYITSSLTVLMGICGLCLIICLSAYLLIYNILYLSVSGKIRYYGLLQALGMKKKQLAQFIRRQVFPLAVLGILAGIALGILFSLFLVPYVMSVLGIRTGGIRLHLYPAVLALSVLAAALAVLWGVHTPVRMAAGISPAEAVRFRGIQVSADSMYKTRRHGHLFWRLAANQLKKDKKKTLVVLLSLAVSLSVFYCLTTIISSYGERTVMPNYQDADLILRNDTQTPEDLSSLQPALDPALLTELQAMDGIQAIHALTGIPVVFPWQEDVFPPFWMQGYAGTKPYVSYEDIKADYQQSPENYYGMLKGIDEAEFDTLNQSLATPLDRQDFLEGKVCVLQYGGFEIPESYTDDFPVTFRIEDQTYQTAIGAVSYEGYYTSAAIGPVLIVSQSYLERLTDNPYILSLNIKYRNRYDAATEQDILNRLDDSPYKNDLTWISSLEEVQTIQESQGNMMEIGILIALLLLLVGTLNYINTMAGSIQSRKLTFSIMESVGMSRKQVYRLLLREGLLYAGFSVFLTLTAGTVVTYCCFQSMNYMEIPFSVPVLPLLCGIALVIIICTVTPVLSYRKLAGKRSIVDRLREYE